MYVFATPVNDVLSNNEAKFWLWKVLENIGRFGLMITLCFVVNKKPKQRNQLFNISAISTLSAYYILWLLYFKGIFNGLTLVGLAVFPTIFFILVSRKTSNIFSTLFAVMFGFFHIAITSSNFL